jgi:hypothetical protein
MDFECYIRLLIMDCVVLFRVVNYGLAVLYLVVNYELRSVISGC